jgi:choline transporter-like protein 2/4/5
MGGKPELQIDERLENGPIEDRGITDIICCLLFIAFWVMTIFIAVVCFRKGDLDRVMRPVDYSGNPCGMGSAKDYPYLMFGKLKTVKKDFLVNTVCVKNCPQKSGETMDCFKNAAYSE